MVSVILVQNHFVVEIVWTSDAQKDRVYSFHGKVSQGSPSMVSDGTLTNHKTGKWLHYTFAMLVFGVMLMLLVWHGYTWLVEKLHHILPF